MARLLDVERRGLLLMAGPFLDPMDGDSMAIFTTPEAADDFMPEDPFVLNGVVAGHTVQALGRSTATWSRLGRAEIPDPRRWSCPCPPHQAGWP